jgi:hypothetical protein
MSEMKFYFIRRRNDWRTRAGLPVSEIVEVGKTVIVRADPQAA